MTPEKKLQLTEIVAMIGLSATVLCSGVAYYFYDRWKFEQDKYMASEIQNSVYSNRSNSFQFNLQKKMDVADTIIDLLIHPQTKIVSVSSEDGLVIFNPELKKFFMKVEREDNKVYYQPVLKNKNTIDSLEVLLPKGDYQEIEYPGEVEEVEVIWK